VTSLHLDLAHEPGSAPRARRAVAAFLRESWPTTDPLLLDLVDDAELVTSELVGNAVRHGLAPVSLDVDADDSSGHHVVTLTCHDAGPWDGSAPSPHGGRGLVLVRGVSTDLRIEGGATSTTVTATLLR
jgi:anti-sigma regulatory factor (Ser/Thr protein kinase)